jgi:hypothetical protein
VLVFSVVYGFPLFMGALCGSGVVLREISGVVWLFFVYLLLFSVRCALLLGGGLLVFAFCVCFVLVVAFGCDL